jgi:hypothetical protein
MLGNHVYNSSLDTLATFVDKELACPQTFSTESILTPANSFGNTIFLVRICVHSVGGWVGVLWLSPRGCRGLEKPYFFFDGAKANALSFQHGTRLRDC